LVSAGPAAAETVHFAVVGDTQGWTWGVNTLVFPAIVEQVLAAEPTIEFVVVVGDLVAGTHDEAAGSDLLAQWARWRDAAGPWYRSAMTGLKVYPVPGNHDLYGPGADGELWRRTFPELPENGPAGEKRLTYSFDAGPVHLALVSTSAPGRRHLVDLDWLARDLESSEQPVKLVFGHEPAFPLFGAAACGLEQAAEARDAFWQLLADQGVGAYFCGHEHTYDHWYREGVHQIITGGGGGVGMCFHYLLVEADETDVRVRALRLNGEVLDEFALSQPELADQDDRSDAAAQAAEMDPCLPPLALLLASAGLAVQALLGPREETLAVRGASTRQ